MNGWATLAFAHWKPLNTSHNGHYFCCKKFLLPAARDKICANHSYLFLVKCYPAMGRPFARETLRRDR